MSKLIKQRNDSEDLPSVCLLFIALFFLFLLLYVFYCVV